VQLYEKSGACTRRLNVEKFIKSVHRGVKLSDIAILTSKNIVRDVINLQIDSLVEREY
jgi:hypothetical protein